MANNQKKFWKRKDGKLILNPLNQKHLIKCSTIPCGDYWAIFGNRTYWLSSYNSNRGDIYRYSVGIYFVSNGKAQWSSTDWDEDQGEYIEVDRCASIDVNARPNGLQKTIYIYHWEEEVPGDQWYDEENDEWIQQDTTWVQHTSTDQWITEWYRISKCYPSKEKAIEAYYYPCGITEAPFPAINSTEWESCYKSYWRNKIVKVSSPLYEYRRETMTARYNLYIDERKSYIVENTFTYSYNPENDEICSGNTSSCTDGSITTYTISSYSTPAVMGSQCYMRIPSGGVYDYRFIDAQTLTDTSYLTCNARKKSYQYADEILAPYITRKLLDKDTFLDSYYLGNRSIYTQSTLYQSYTLFGHEMFEYRGNGTLITETSYYSENSYPNDRYDEIHRTNSWVRFAFKRTQQTLPEAIGIKVQINIDDIKKDRYSYNTSTSSLVSSSLTTIIEYDKYYEDLPLPTHFNILDLISTCNCIVKHDYDQETGEIIYTWDESESGCNFPVYYPSPINYYESVSHWKEEYFKVRIKVIDVVFPEEFIKSGYAVEGEKDYEN